MWERTLGIWKTFFSLKLFFFKNHSEVLTWPNKAKKVNADFVSIQFCLFFKEKPNLVKSGDFESLYIFEFHCPGIRYHGWSNRVKRKKEKSLNSDIWLNQIRHLKNDISKNKLEIQKKKH